jgi:hypothetical protein
MPMTTRPPTHGEGGECLTTQPGRHRAPARTPHATPTPPRRNGAQPRSHPATRPDQDPAGEGCPPGTIPSDRKYDLSDDEREWVSRTVDSLGPLTEHDREFLGMILHRRRRRT